MLHFYEPKWDLPTEVNALITTRSGGISTGPFESFNLGAHVGDDAELVAQNRLQLPLSEQILWLDQVHGTDILDWELGIEGQNQADASYTNHTYQLCAVMTADCLPLLMCSELGDEVAAVHCGWRGIKDGIVEKAVEKFTCSPQQILCYIGPHIGPCHFEVGNEVKQEFVSLSFSHEHAFHARADDKSMCDLSLIVTQKLNALGVNKITKNPDCTFCDPKQYYSYRRDGQTGRFASMIWIK